MLNYLIPRMQSNAVLSLTFLLVTILYEGSDDNGALLNTSPPDLSPEFQQPLFKNLLGFWPAGTRILGSAEKFIEIPLFWS